MPYILGIDPGNVGAYAILLDNNLIKFNPLPVIDSKISVGALKEILGHIKDYTDTNLIVYIERPFLARSSNDTMYINYGRILACLELLKIEYKEVRPQQWQKALGLKKTGKGDKPSIRYIAQKYPAKNFDRSEWFKTNKPKIHDGVTDAVCIAEFGVIRENLKD
jgi:hypothetical protein